MEITEIICTQERLDYIAKHEVSQQEVEDICLGDHFVEKQEPNVFRVSGQTSAGRYLKVVIRRVRGTIFRLITAFEMNPSEKHSYRKRVKGKK